MHERILNTWAHSTHYYDWVDVKFFLGHPWFLHQRSSEVYLSCNDDYDSLTSKVHAILHWFQVADEYSHIFICDTDTYVDIPKLIMAFTGKEEYVGFTGMNGIHGAAHGGPGYWLSKKSVDEVLSRATQNNINQIKQDEWWVYERLQEAKIEPVHDDRYSLLTTPGYAHSCITYHDSRVRSDLDSLNYWHSCAAPPKWTPEYRPHPLSI